jgi:hypothetical protein
MVDRPMYYFRINAFAPTWTCKYDFETLYVGLSQICKCDEIQIHKHLLLVTE